MRIDLIVIVLLAYFLPINSLSSQLATSLQNHDQKYDELQQTMKDLQEVKDQLRSSREEETTLRSQINALEEELKSQIDQLMYLKDSIMLSEPQFKLKKI